MDVQMDLETTIPVLLSPTDHDLAPSTFHTEGDDSVGDAEIEEQQVDLEKEDDLLHEDAQRVDVEELRTSPSLVDTPVEEGTSGAIDSECDVIDAEPQQAQRLRVSDITLVMDDERRSKRATNGPGGLD